MQKYYRYIDVGYVIIRYKVFVRGGAFDGGP